MFIRGEVRRLVQQGRQAAGAMVRSFRWWRVFRGTGSLNELSTASPVSFFRRARIFLVPIALSHAMPWLSLAATADRVDLAAGPWVWSGAARGMLEVVSG